jgi:hypothetical protein
VPAVPTQDYYLTQPQQPAGLDAVTTDLTTGWTSNNVGLVIGHIDPNTQVAIYLNGNYLYSVSGTDYANMTRDAMKNIKTVSYTLDNMQQRSDGAYVLSGTHQFYDVNNNLKTVGVDFTVSPVGGKWIIVAAGSSELETT